MKIGDNPKRNRSHVRIPGTVGRVQLGIPKLKLAERKHIYTVYIGPQVFYTQLLESGAGEGITELQCFKTDKIDVLQPPGAGLRIVEIVGIAIGQPGIKSILAWIGFRPPVGRNGKKIAAVGAGTIIERNNSVAADDTIGAPGTLEENTEMYYMTSAFYTPSAARGARFDDPFFNIAWPLLATVVSEQDRNWPLMRR